MSRVDARRDGDDDEDDDGGCGRRVLGGGCMYVCVRGVVTTCLARWPSPARGL